VRGINPVSQICVVSCLYIGSQPVADASHTYIPQ